MEIGLSHYLTVSAILFTIGVFGIFLNRKNVIIILMSIELILLSSVIGAQYGVRVGQKLKGEQLRALLAILILAVGIRLAFGLVVTPSDLFSVVFEGSPQ